MTVCCIHTVYLLMTGYRHIILRCVIPVVCLNYRKGVNFRQKHNFNVAKIMVFIAEQNKNYMFRPISAIIRFSQHCHTV